MLKLRFLRMTGIAKKVATGSCNFAPCFKPGNLLLSIRARTLGLGMLVIAGDTTIFRESQGSHTAS